MPFAETISSVFFHGVFRLDDRNAHDAIIGSRGVLSGAETISCGPLGTPIPEFAAVEGNSFNQMVRSQVRDYLGLRRSVAAG